jgi:hypothetical protein
MSLRILGVVAAALAVASLESVAAGGQEGSPKRSAQTQWTLTRTPDGQPDLQGYWTNATFTPLERPAELAGKEFLTEAEAVAYEKQAVLRENSQSKDDIHYDNVIWQSESYPKGAESRRTSVIFDPADGKIPPLTEPACDRALHTHRHRHDPVPIHPR